MSNETTKTVICSTAKIILRNDVAENWKNTNPTLLKGELGAEILTDGSARLKIGDGKRSWNELPYFNEIKDLPEAVNDTVSSLKELKADRSEVYTKTEIDALFEGITSVLATVVSGGAE